MNLVTIEYTVRDEFNVDIEELGDILLEDYIDCYETTGDIDDIINHFNDNMNSFLVDIGFPSNIYMNDEELNDAYYEIEPELREYLTEKLEKL